jgi:hypothetical protein
MACCGSKRAQAGTRSGARHDRPGESRPGAPGAPPRPIDPAGSPSLVLRYLGSGALSLRGPRTGRVYHVPGTSDLVTVHPDDGPALLRTGLFAAGQDG